MLNKAMRSTLLLPRTSQHCKLMQRDARMDAPTESFSTGVTVSSLRRGALGDLGERDWGTVGMVAFLPSLWHSVVWPVAPSFAPAPCSSFRLGDEE